MNFEMGNMKSISLHFSVFKSIYINIGLNSIRTKQMIASKEISTVKFKFHIYITYVYSKFLDKIGIKLYLFSHKFEIHYE